MNLQQILSDLTNRFTSFVQGRSPNKLIMDELSQRFNQYQPKAPDVDVRTVNRPLPSFDFQSLTDRFAGRFNVPKISIPKLPPNYGVRNFDADSIAQRFLKWTTARPQNLTPAGYAVEKFQEATRPLAVGLREWKAPLEDEAQGFISSLPQQLQSAVGGAFPVTQLPSFAGETARQAGRYLTLSPTALDIATAPLMFMGGTKAVGKVAARKELSGLLNYSDDLLRRGFTPGEIDRISYAKYKDIVAKGVEPEAMRLAKQTMGNFLKDNPGIENANIFKRIASAWNETFARVKNTPPAFQEAFTSWVNTRNAARTTGTQVADSFRTIPQDVGEQVINYLENPSLKASPQVVNAAKSVRQEFDQLYSMAQHEGLGFKYLRDYVSHIWQNTAEDVQKVYSASRNFRFGKERSIPTYIEGRQLGLVPKFTHPSQILGEYVRRLEETKANIQFMKTLKSQGLITNKYAPGMLRIDAVGFGQKAYASPKLANLINSMFNPDTGESVLKLTGELSGFLQDFSLAGGIPTTPVNAFTAAQMLKDVTALRFVAPVKSLIRSLFDDLSTNYFRQKLPVIKEMQMNGIPIRTTFDYSTFFENTAVKKTLKDVAGDAWNSVFNKPTFERFLPQLQIEFYEGAKRKFMNKGEAIAQSMASEATKKFYGIINEQVLARPQETSNAMRTFLFAPKYRESMVNFWGNLLNPKELVKPENFALRRFWVGLGLTFAAYNALNKSTTGKNLWENPPGKELTALVPVGDTTLGFPILSSIATMPRMAVSMLNYLAHGDIAKAGLESRKSMSMLTKPLMDALANEDYFGQEIYKEDDEPKDKWAKILAYIGGQWNHPFIREAINVLVGKQTKEANGHVIVEKKPLSQGIANALELPIRFYKTQSLVTGEFWDDYYKLEKVAKKYKELPAAEQEAYAQAHQEELVQYVAMSAIVGSYSDLKRTLGKETATTYLAGQTGKQATSVQPMQPSTLGTTVQQAGDMTQVKADVRKLLSLGASQDKIKEYVASRGFNGDSVLSTVLSERKTTSEITAGLVSDAKRMFNQGIGEANIRQYITEQGADPDIVLEKARVSAVRSLTGAKGTGRSRVPAIKVPSFTAPRKTSLPKITVAKAKYGKIKFPKVKKFKVKKLAKLKIKKLKVRKLA